MVGASTTVSAHRPVSSPVHLFARLTDKNGQFGSFFRLLSEQAGGLLARRTAHRSAISPIFGRASASPYDLGRFSRKTIPAAVLRPWCLQSATRFRNLSRSPACNPPFAPNVQRTRRPIVNFKPSGPRWAIPFFAGPLVGQHLAGRGGRTGRPAPRTSKMEPWPSDARTRARGARWPLSYSGHKRPTHLCPEPTTPNDGASIPGGPGAGVRATRTRYGTGGISAPPATARRFTTPGRRWCGGRLSRGAVSKFKLDPA